MKQRGPIYDGRKAGQDESYFSPDLDTILMSDGGLPFYGPLGTDRGWEEYRS